MSKNKNKEENVSAQTPVDQQQVVVEPTVEETVLVETTEANDSNIKTKEEDGAGTAETPKMEEPVTEAPVEKTPTTSSMRVPFEMKEENGMLVKGEDLESKQDETVETSSNTTTQTNRRLVVTKTGRFSNEEVQHRLKAAGLNSAVDTDGKIILAHVGPETSEHSVRPFIKRAVAAGFKAEIQ